MKGKGLKMQCSDKTFKVNDLNDAIQQNFWIIQLFLGVLFKYLACHFQDVYLDNIKWISIKGNDRKQFKIYSILKLKSKEYTNKRFNAINLFWKIVKQKYLSKSFWCVFCFKRFYYSSIKYTVVLFVECNDSYM